VRQTDGVLTLTAPAALVGATVSGPTSVFVDGGRIIDVGGPGSAYPGDHVALGSGLLTAGLVDLQVNGCFGVDFTNATPHARLEARRALLTTGVTAFVPTLLTAPLEDLLAQVASWGAQVDDSVGGARVLASTSRGRSSRPRVPAHTGSSG